MTEAAVSNEFVSTPDPVTSGELLARVLDSSTDCIAVFDPKDRLVFISDGGLRLLGYSARREILGRPWTDFWSGPSEGPATATDEARTSGSARFQGVAGAVHSRARWWDVTLTAMDGTGDGSRPVLMIARDITDRKRDDEHRDLLTRELSHRIQNIFTVVTSLISVSARAEPSARPFADKLKARLEALWKAHDYVRPAPGRLGLPQSIHGLTSALLAAYPAEQISLSGDDVPVEPQAASAFALIIHELATNAIKYGALSASSGHLAIRTEEDADTVTLTWAESGGPALDGPPAHFGFGSTLASRSAAGQLSGQIDYDWKNVGLHVTLRLARAALAR